MMMLDGSMKEAIVCYKSQVRLINTYQKRKLVGSIKPIYLTPSPPFEQDTVRIRNPHMPTHAIRAFPHDLGPTPPYPRDSNPKTLHDSDIMSSPTTQFMPKI